jgi:hypothetical protein
MSIYRVRFKGENYLLIGDLPRGGAIALEETYLRGDVSFAHLGWDGLIRRYNEVIGERQDLEMLGKVEDEKAELPLSEDWFDNVLDAPSWRERPI